jgi:hypothetical protein
MGLGSDVDADRRGQRPQCDNTINLAWQPFLPGLRKLNCGQKGAVYVQLQTYNQIRQSRIRLSVPPHGLTGNLSHVGPGSNVTPNNILEKHAHPTAPFNRVPQPWKSGKIILDEIAQRDHCIPLNCVSSWRRRLHGLIRVKREELTVLAKLLLAFHIINITLWCSGQDGRLPAKALFETCESKALQASAERWCCNCERRYAGCRTRQYKYPKSSGNVRLGESLQPTSRGRVPDGRV